MSSEKNINRRQLLQSMAASGALVKWPALAASVDPTQTPKPYQVLSPAQAAVLEAMVDQFVPADDFPGARQNGAVHCIDQKLAGPYGSFFMSRYQAGLKQMEELHFASLDAGRQTALLQAIEQGAHGAALQEFFETVLGDTFDSYYGSPEDGGNPGGVSWKMIGFRG
jgi:hypothetical protein